MIKNEKEFRTTRAALAGFEDAIANFDVMKVIETGVDPLLAKMQLVSYERQANLLRGQVEAYVALKAGLKPTISVQTITEIGRGLLEARVAKGLTQRELANLIGCQEQQIQRYEKDFYVSANLRRIEQIANAIGIEFSGTFVVAPDCTSGEHDLPEGLSLADFPFAEMNQRGWFGKPEEFRRASSAIKTAALKTFLSQAPQESQSALHRKSSGNASSSRTAALLVWQARILSKARQRTGLARNFSPPSAEVISNLAKFSRDEKGIISVVEALLEYGIIVVFEKHLQKTKLDGAAMSLDGGKYAVIGLTARHDRIDNFWFVLLHEIGHLMRHWSTVVNGGIIDENTGENSKDILENQADEFAENAILPKISWQSSMIRYSKSAESIKDFARRLDLHPALIAGRIRKERGYTEFSELLGNGDVRSALRSAGFLE